VPACARENALDCLSCLNLSRLNRYVPLAKNVSTSIDHNDSVRSSNDMLERNDYGRILKAYGDDLAQDFAIIGAFTSLGTR
jgi:hypothetical protein